MTSRVVAIESIGPFGDNDFGYYCSVARCGREARHRVTREHYGEPPRHPYTAGRHTMSVAYACHKHRPEIED